MTECCVKKTKAKKVNRYVCSVCGMVVLVEKPCKCKECDIICCGKQLEPITKTKKK